jgi:hypothetical protein
MKEWKGIGLEIGNLDMDVVLSKREKRTGTHLLAALAPTTIPILLLRTGCVACMICTHRESIELSPGQPQGCATGAAAACVSSAAAWASTTVSGGTHDAFGETTDSALYNGLTVFLLGVGMVNG